MQKMMRNSNATDPTDLPKKKGLLGIPQRKRIKSEPSSFKGIPRLSKSLLIHLTMIRFILLDQTLRGLLLRPSFTFNYYVGFYTEDSRTRVASHHPNHYHLLKVRVPRSTWNFRKWRQHLTLAEVLQQHFGGGWGILKAFAKKGRREYS